MPATYTPIRYPGGKTKLYDYVRLLMEKNNLLGGTYCEPFAGGAGLALKLLLKNDVDRIIINDADPAIYAVWDMIIHNAEELCDYVQHVALTVDQWDKEREVYLKKDEHSAAELAKATFFLNRTNISGVITGGMIGGREQTGNYTMEARFNRQTLIEKIRKISSVSSKIDLYGLDALEFMDSVFPSLSENSLVNFDPPYVKKGGALYKNSFTEEDHKRLKDKIADFEGNWIVTYDICELISKLYKDYRHDELDVYYSAKTVSKAKEYIFFSNHLQIDKLS